MSWALLLLTICAFSAYADRVTGARKALQKNQPEQARKLLDKELAKHPQNAGAKYIYAQLFLQADSTGSGLDSAYAYLQQAAQFFSQTDAKTRKSWRKQGITDEAIAQKRAYVVARAFTISQAADTEAAYISFLSRFPEVEQRLEAIQRRDELAFALASRENTYDSYKLFIKKYPDSQQAREAGKLYELLLYEFHTKDDDLQAYELFVELYPKSPYRAQAEKRMYELFTTSHTRKTYHDFIKQYPGNAYAKITPIFMTANGWSN
jgi:outer membrane protein assembly factor BamD (BamD/ComL family)